MSKIPYKFIPVPELFVDLLLPLMNESELKVFLFINRSTWGFQKQKDRIAMSQFREGRITRAGKVLCRGTGLSNETLQKAIYVLERMKIISAERARGNISIYRLNYDFPIADLKKEHFDAARWEYSRRERKCEVSPARKATFLRNRESTSIEPIGTFLAPRKTISTVTEDTSQNILLRDTSAADAAPHENGGEKKIFSKTIDTQASKEIFVQDLITRGLPEDTAKKHVNVSSAAELSAHLKAIDDATPKLKQAYFDSWIQRYQK